MAGKTPITSKSKASKTAVQPKLSVNSPGDVYEQEADAMANQIIDAPVNAPQAASAQGHGITSIQRTGQGDGAPVSQSFAAGLQTSGEGNALPAETQRFMERAFSTDFSKVRIHTNAKATDLNESIQARAFTHGNNIYFKQGEYAPHSREGQKLLAHELTHTVQQQNGANPAIQRAIEIRPFSERLHEGFDRAQELIDRLNGLSAAIQYNLNGNTLEYTIADAAAMTHFDTQMQAFIDNTDVMVPIRLVTSSRRVIGDDYQAGTVDLDDLLASDDLGLQSVLLHFLTERFATRRYAERMNTAALRTRDNIGQPRQPFVSAHDAGHVAQAEHFRAIFNDPDINFNYEELKPNGTYHIVFKSIPGHYRVFMILTRVLAGGQVRATSGATIMVRTAAGEWLTPDEFIARRQAAPAPVVQPKLKVNTPGDKYEQQADAMAERVMRMTVHGNAGTPINNISAGVVSPKSTDKDEAVPASFAASLHASQGGGEPLPPDTKAFMEYAFSRDLSGVRIHTGTNAHEMNSSIGARAFTHQQDIYFNKGEYAPKNNEGQKLLAHELTHVVQQNNGDTPALQRQPTNKPALPVDQLFELVTQVRNATGVMTELIRVLEGVSMPTEQSKEILDALKERESQATAYADIVALVIKNPATLSTPTSLSTVSFSSAIAALAPEDESDYWGSDLPFKQQIVLRANYHNRLTTLLNLILPQVKDMSAQATGSGSNPDYVHTTYHIIMAHYIRLIKLPLTQALPKLTFLMTYYQSQNVINWYAIARYVKGNLRPFYDSFIKVKQVYNYPTSFDAIRPVEKSTRKPSTVNEIAEERTFEAIRNLDILCEIVGEPPASAMEVTAVQLPADPSQFVEMFLDAHALIAILALWKPLDALSTIMNQALYAGTSITGIDADDRKRWISEMESLRGVFADEIRKHTHPDLEKNYDGWNDRVQTLIDEIPPSVKKRLIVAAVVEQIPFLFVGGATVMKVGLWVSRITRGSRLLIALAEGATMTTLNFMVSAPGSAGRPTTVTGWIGQLAMNVAFAGVGRFLFQGSGAIMDKMAAGRNALVQIGGRIAVPIVGMNLIQTTAQYIQQHVTKHGGETSFSEMFTLNLIMNGLGLLIGAATLPPKPASTAIVPSGNTPPVVARPTVAELAKQAGVPEDVAAVLLEIADKAESYQAMLTEIQNAVQKNKLTPEQFERFRQNALELIDFLAARVPKIAPHFANGMSKGDILAALAAARARAQGWTYSASPKVLALLPEATEGLVRVGNTDNYLYAKDKPPKGLPALLEDNRKRGVPVKELPGGGWEMLPTGNLKPIRLLPAANVAVENAPPSIETLAKGPAAEAGLASLRNQKHVTPTLLEAQLAASADNKANSDSVTIILRILGVLKSTDKLAWMGLERYFSHGGDAQTLRRALNIPDGKSMPLEKDFHVSKLLSRMATWDQEAVQGLQALYKVRPKTTTAEIGILINDVPAEIGTGVLQSLAVLEPRSRGLGKVMGSFLTDTTFGGSALTPQQIGAVGALRSGIELATKYPGSELVFEEPRVNAAGDVERVTDINVYDVVTKREAGVVKTTKTLIVSAEIKEVGFGSLGKKAPDQLASDMARDSSLRKGRTTPLGASRPFFETILWRVRRTDFQSEAMRRLNTTNPQDPRVDLMMRTMVETLLESAFDKPAFKKLPQAEQDGYRAGFRNVPFVEFY